jgi:hypothetical protein
VLWDSLKLGEEGFSQHGQLLKDKKGILNFHRTEGLHASLAAG